MSEEKEQTEEEFCARMVQPYRSYISETPELLSLLYDIDLLPEQVLTFNKPVNAIRMAAFCEIFKRIPVENKGDN